MNYGWLAFGLLYAWGAVTLYSSAPGERSYARLLLAFTWPMIIFFLPKHAARNRSAKK